MLALLATLSALLQHTCLKAQISWHSRAADIHPSSDKDRVCCAMRVTSCSADLASASPRASNELTFASCLSTSLAALWSLSATSLAPPLGGSVPHVFCEVHCFAGNMASSPLAELPAAEVVRSMLCGLLARNPRLPSSLWICAASFAYSAARPCASSSRWNDAGPVAHAAVLGEV